jgi:hypothetical protein
MKTQPPTTYEPGRCPRCHSRSIVTGIRQRGVGMYGYARCRQCRGLYEKSTGRPDVEVNARNLIRYLVVLLPVVLVILVLLLVRGA